MTKTMSRLFRAAFSAVVVIVVAACSSNDASTYVASAKGYLAKADYKAAIIQLKNAVDKAPNDAEVRFLLAKALLDAQDPVSAETEARKALDLKYSPSDVYPVLARAMLLQGKLEPMIRELGAIKLESDTRPQRSRHLACHGARGARQSPRSRCGHRHGVARDARRSARAGDQGAAFRAGGQVRRSR